VENRPSVRDLWKDQHEHTQNYGMVQAYLHSRVLNTGCPPDEQSRVQNFVNETELIRAVQFSHRIHSLSIPSDDRFKASSKTIRPHSAI